MHGIQKVLAMILMLTLLLGLCAAAQAETAQPDEAWLKANLLTEVPSTEEGEISKHVALAETQVAVKGDQVIVQGDPCQGLNEKTVYTLTVNLSQITLEDKTMWTLDSVQPLSVEDPKQERDDAHALPENDETLTAPTAEELAALIEVQGLCDHGETMLDLSKVQYDLVTYKDEAGAVHARITFHTAKVVDALSDVIGKKHAGTVLNDMQVLFTLTESGAEAASWDLSKIQLRFNVACKKKPDYYTVKYVDGCDGKVFAKEVYKVKYRTLTPYCEANVYADELRPGYTFAGWDPEFAEKVKKNVTYTAQWVAKDYTITYAGVPEGAVNPNPATYTIENSVQLGDLITDGFMGWVDADGNTVTQIPEGTTGNITLTAVILDAPYAGPGNGNSVMNKADHVWATFHCTTCGEHHDYDLLSLMGNAYNLTYTWNAERKVYVGTVDASMSTLLNFHNSKVVKAMGGIRHYHVDGAEFVTLHGVWVPDSSARSGGLWYPDGETPVINVKCFTAPVAPTEEQLTGSAYTNKSAKFFIRDWALTTNYVRQNTLLPGTFTMGEMSEPVVNGKSTSWTIQITVTDLAPYVALMDGKSTGTYKVDWDATTTSLTYNLKYTFTPSASNNNSLEPDQTGTKWSVSLPSSEQLNGKQIWLLPQWTTTYTDGAEGTAFEDKVIVYPTSTKDIAKNVLKNGSIATPAFGEDPVREDYVFNGWEPAVSPKLTANATYTATWLKQYTITYVGVPEGVVNPNPSTYTEKDSVELSALVTDGFMGWVDADGNPVTKIPEGTTGDITLTADILDAPHGGPGNGNSVSNQSEHVWATFHCTTCGEHHDYDLLSLLGNAYNLTRTWDADRQAYVGTVDINMSTLLNYYTGKVVKAMGGIRHYQVDGADYVTLHGVWVPDSTARYGGLWYPDGKTPVINVKCYTEPVAPTMEQLTGSAYTNKSAKFFIRDWALNSNYVRQNTLLPGTFTMSEMSEPVVNGKSTTWTIQITVTDLAPYVALMDGKSTGVYKIDWDATNTSLTYDLKYTFTPSTSNNNSLEPDQTGTKWTISLPSSEKNNGKQIWLLPQWTTTYTDGAEGAVFEDKAIVYPNSSKDIAKNVLKSGSIATPAFGEDPVREGYTFAGWDPEFSAKLTNSVTYTAQWTPNTYTVTFVVPDGVEQPADMTYQYGTALDLPTLSVDGFNGWADANGTVLTTLPVGTIGDQTLTANIVAKPTLPKRGTNVSENLLTFQCTTHEEHAFTNSIYFSANANRTYWNASAKRWETYVTAQYSNINTTQTCKNYFGGIKHYYASGAQSEKIYLYWNPTAAGETATGTPVVGQWYAMSGNPVKLDVWCFDKPAAPQKISQIKTSLWIRDWTLLGNNVKTTSVVEGSYTMGEVYGNATDGFYIDVTINDLSAYIPSKLASKITGQYIVDPAQNSATISYRLKYTGSTTDYKQDGSGWAVDKSDWTAQEKNNGKTIWIIPQWTTTYTDGADGAVFADMVITYPTSSAGIAQDVLKSGSIATPAFGEDPVREGFTFAGWDPEVSESLTNSVTYTAQWTPVVEPEPSEEPDPTETPAPEPSEEPDPTETPAPEVSEEPDPTETPAPEVSEEPDPTETPAPEVSEEPDPTETPAPEVSEEPGPTETPAPEVSEEPDPTETPAPSEPIAASSTDLAVMPETSVVPGKEDDAE